MTTPYFTYGNILHYWSNGELKTFNCSNKNIENYDNEAIPENVVRALLRTKEYCWIKGDKYNAYFSEVYHKCWKTSKASNVDKVGNTSSNPGYGVVRQILPEGGYTAGTECPRCRLVHAIYNCKKLKPFKYKVWDFFNGIRFDIIGFFLHISVRVREFLFVHSKSGKEKLAEIAKGMAENYNDVYFLVDWRKAWLKPIIKLTGAAYTKVENGWAISLMLCESSLRRFAAFGIDTSKLKSIC